MASVGRSKSSVIVTGLFGKLRIFNQVSRPPTYGVRRCLHVDAYEKNVEEEVAPTIVPDNIVQPDSEKYWAPHPETGVFGPETEVDPATFQAPSDINKTEESVLDQPAFFRPQEDLDVPVETLDVPVEDFDRHDDP